MEFGKPSPVHRAAERFGILYRPPRPCAIDEAAETFRSHEADVAVVVAYGMILPQSILDVPELGCLNLSCLPSAALARRGADPARYMAGDARDRRRGDAHGKGPGYRPCRLWSSASPSVPDMTAGELHDRLSLLGADLMVRALAALSRGGLAFTPQPEEGVTYVC